MSLTLQQLIDQAVSLATRGTDPSTSPALAAEMVTEDLLTVVFNDLGTAMARNPATRSLLRRTKTAAFVAGVYAIDADVLTEHMQDSALYDPADTSKLYSFVSSWERFIRDDADSRIGRYAVEGESLLYVAEPFAAFDPATGATISLKLTVPCVPVVPAAPGTAIAIREELEGELIARLARALQPN